jgi:hypothetical protein
MPWALVGDVETVVLIHRHPGDRVQRSGLVLDGDRADERAGVLVETDAYHGKSKTPATLGRVEEALPHIAQELDPMSLIILMSLGWEPAVARRYEESAVALQARAGYVSPFDLSPICEELGERDRAIEMTTKACDERSPPLLFAGAEPVFASFRRDARFTEIPRRMKLA